MTAAFLHTGPLGAAQLGQHLQDAVSEIARWMDEFGPYEPHRSLDVDTAALAAAHAELTERLRDNYPFFHPRYIGQMLKPPHPAAVLGYVTTMLINPNNHALDGGPATARMETRGRRATRDDVRVRRAPRPPDQQRHHRQPRGAVRGARAAPRHGHRLQRRRPLHPQPHVPPARRPGTRRRHRRARTHGPRRARGAAARRLRRHGRHDRRHHRARRDRPDRRGRRAVRPLTAPASTSTPPTAASSGSSPTTPPTAWRPRRSARSPTATPSSSTRTSTACSPTAAELCCSATRRWPPTTCTTRPTPTSPPTRCTSGRSPWSAPAPARPRRRSG